MAKKKKTKVENLFYLVALVLCVVAVCMLFVDALKVDVLLGTATYTGAQITFGYATDYVTYFSFSILNLIPYILVAVSAVIFVLKMAKMAKAKYWDLVTVAMLVIAAVLFFLAPSLVVSDMYDGFTKSLAIGSILSAVLSICAGVAITIKSLKK